ncbi:MAG: Hsp20/alpha crystallin family protein [Planctomycetota bacterium]|jgi:HSP20 family protein
MALLPKKRSEGGTGALPGLQREMNRLFESFFDRMELPSLFGSGGFAPVMDVVETADEVLVKAEIPGVDPKELNIAVIGDALTVKGEKKTEHEEKDKNFHLLERSHGSFSRTVTLPSYADSGKVSAEYKDGILTVHFAKRGEAQGKTIKVEVK